MFLDNTNKNQHRKKERKEERKDPVAGKDWGQEKKGTTEDEMAGWHHQLDAQGFG